MSGNDRATLTSFAEALSEVVALRTSLVRGCSSFVTSFDEMYDAWKKNWIGGTESSYSGLKFEALIKRGPVIIPLVVEKLTHSTEDFVVNLCKPVGPRLHKLS